MQRWLSVCRPGSGSPGRFRHLGLHPRQLHDALNTTPTVPYAHDEPLDAPGATSAPEPKPAHLKKDPHLTTSSLPTTDFEPPDSLPGHNTTSLLRIVAAPGSIVKQRCSITPRVSKFPALKSGERSAAVVPGPLGLVQEVGPKGTWEHQADNLNRMYSDPRRYRLAKTEFNRWKRHLIKKRAGLRAHKTDHQRKAHLENGTLSILLKHDNVHNIAAAWRGLVSEQQAEKELTTIVMDLLSSNADKVPLVLEAILTNTNPKPPFYIIQDCLNLLAEKAKLIGDGARRRTFVLRLFGFMKAVMKGSPAYYTRIHQSTIHMFIDNLSDPEVVELFKGLERAFHPLSTNTLLQFASRLAKTTSLKWMAIQIMRRLVKGKKLDINSPVGASICTSILLPKRGDGIDDPNEQAQLARRLFSLKMQPNLITYTVMIDDLCRAGNLEAAWGVYDIMRGHNIEPDFYLLQAMMRAAGNTRDFESLQRIVSLAIDHAILSPSLWNTFLHAVLQSAPEETKRTRMKSVEAFRLMMSAYTRLFKAEPLRAVCGDPLDGYLGAGVLDDLDSDIGDVIGKIPRPNHDQGPILPDSVTLNIMLLGYIRSMGEPYDVLMFYQRFRSLLKSGDSVVSTLVSGGNTHVHDVVIKALCDFDVTWRFSAFEVMSDMLKDVIHSPTGTTAAESTETATSEPHRHPPPSIYTWTIVLDGLMRNGQVDKAERLLQMMRQHNLEPSVVTWNTLVAGYSRLKMVNATVGALQRLERAGYKSDEYTIRAFGLLGDNQRLALDLIERAAAELRRSQSCGALDTQEEKRRRRKEGKKRRKEELTQAESITRLQSLNKDPTALDLLEHTH